MSNSSSRQGIHHGNTTHVRTTRRRTPHGAAQRPTSPVGCRMHRFAPVLAVGTRMGCRTTARQMSRCLTEPPSSCRRLVFQGNVGLFDRLGSHRSKLEQAMAPGQDAGQGTSGWAPCRSGWRLTALRPRPGPRRDWQFGSFKVVTQLARGGPGTSARGHPSRPYQSHPSVRGAFDVARHRGPPCPRESPPAGAPSNWGKATCRAPHDQP